MATFTLDEMGANQLGRAVVEAAAPGWDCKVGWFNGPGGRQLLLKFQRDSWTGTQIEQNRFGRANYNVHAEIDLMRTSNWVLAVHFETEPYMPQERLRELDGYEEFEAMRSGFRAAVHQGIEEGAVWQPRDSALQVCRFRSGLSAESADSEIVSALAGALTRIGPVVDGALAVLRKTP
jgi:hypothetical protein